MSPLTSITLLLLGLASLTQAATPTPELPPATVQRLSAPIDPAATELVLNALAKFQNIESLPAFHLNYELSATRTKLAIPVTKTRSADSIRRVLLARHDLGEPYSWDEVLSSLADPQNPATSTRQLAIYSKTWSNDGQTSHNYHQWEYWTGDEFLSGSSRYGKPEIYRYNDRFSGSSWDLAHLGLIDTLPSGQVKLPMNEDRSWEFAAPRKSLPLAASRFIAAPDENFCGTHCAVVDATDLARRFYIDRETGRLMGIFRSVWQGYPKVPYWKIAHDSLQLERQPFENYKDFAAWHDALPEDHWTLVMRDAGNHLNNHAGVDINPSSINRFYDYVELAPGVDYPRSHDVARAVPTDRNHTAFEHYFYRYRVTAHDTAVDPASFDRFIPKPGYAITDFRSGTAIEYTYRDDMPQSELDNLVNQARLAEAENEQRFAAMAAPFDAMLGKPAPSLDTATWISSPASVEGRPYILHFWATWCGACERDYPKLKSIAASTPVVGVHAPGTAIDKVRSIAAAKGLTYPVLLAPESSDGSVAGYPNKMYPYAVLVDASGKVASHGSLEKVTGDLASLK